MAGERLRAAPADLGDEPAFAHGPSGQLGEQIFGFLLAVAGRAEQQTLRLERRSKRFH